MLGILALRGPQHLDGPRRLAEADVQRPQIGGLVGSQLALSGELDQSSPLPPHSACGPDPLTRRRSA